MPVSPRSQKPLPLKLTFFTIIFLFLYIILPIYLTLGRTNPLLVLSLFFLINILAVLYLSKKYYNKRYALEYKIQELEEKFNILKDQNNTELKNNSALEVKIQRYRKLKDIIEELNRNLNFESVAEKLTSIAFANISNNKGACILYLIDKQLNLQIFKTKKEDRELIISAKEGDIFDHWVLRHISPLFVENVKQDFRFDLEKLNKQETRTISSLINSPLVSEHRFLGTLRLDSPRPYNFTQDDLRFLVSICDLAAVALENSELFQRAQVLAIHDTLTALYTKGYFTQRLKDECKRNMRQESVFSLLMLDIDLFKNYNDKFGHTAGDIVLKRISQIILESSKDLNPVLCRFGGEEFCVMLPGIDKKNGYRYANILREKIDNEKIILRRQETFVTVSIGVAAFPEDGTDQDELIRKADKAIYLAKEKGRNRVCQT